VAACSALLACGSGEKPPVVPVACLANSAAGQAAYRRLEGRWADLPPERRRELEGDLRAFIVRFGSEDVARLERLRLALVVMEDGRLIEAHSLANQVRRGSPGAMRDFADIVEAAALRLDGRLMDALALLEPLRNKIADAEQRSVYSEQLVRALVAARAYEQAIRAMLDWAEQTPQVERDQVVASIDGFIGAMPIAAVESGLGVLSEEERAEGPGQRSTRAEARRWLMNTARARLVRTALANRDPELARRLLDAGPLKLGSDESREALSALAATGLGSASVAGRSIGFVLDVVTDASRRRSAEVAEGMTRALGLPASASDAHAPQLVTRDASEPGDVERALRGLAGDGASILVAGVTDAAALEASRFAERAQVPVLLLSRPAGLGEGIRFTFVLGASAIEESRAVDAALVKAGIHTPMRIGPGGVPCEAASPGTGGTRFPIADWKHSGVDALVLLGEAECTRDALAEAVQGGFAPLFVLGLESAELAGTVSGRELVLGAGRFPFAASQRGDVERAYLSRWGEAPSWFEALGHDAALVAAAVLADFPLDRVEDKGAVVGLHWRAQGRLMHVEAPLWTTRAKSFAGANVLSRRLEALTPGGIP
jgi:hypothetical protein